MLDSSSLVSDPKGMGDRVLNASYVFIENTYKICFDPPKTESEVAAILDEMFRCVVQNIADAGRKQPDTFSQYEQHRNLVAKKISKTDLNVSINDRIDQILDSALFKMYSAEVKATPFREVCGGEYNSQYYSLLSDEMKKIVPNPFPPTLKEWIITVLDSFLSKDLVTDLPKEIIEKFCRDIILPMEIETNSKFFQARGIDCEGLSTVMLKVGIEVNELGPECMKIANHFEPEYKEWILYFIVFYVGLENKPLQTISFVKEKIAKMNSKLNVPPEDVVEKLQISIDEIIEFKTITNTTVWICRNKISWIDLFLDLRSDNEQKLRSQACNLAESISKFPNQYHQDIKALIIAWVKDKMRSTSKEMNAMQNKCTIM
ncbi:MAG: hypothetical protein VX777_01015 [Chlamydiota bacterium]|nr:hypothetical protein [Chlamydiota bacterium]